MLRVGVQGDPCTTTIFRYIVRRRLLYSASSPVHLTKYSILHNEVLSLSIGSIKRLLKLRNLNSAESTHEGCVRLFLLPCGTSHKYDCELNALYYRAPFDGFR
jgi:hypothetical protein